jgi:hypothetical protein
MCRGMPPCPWHVCGGGPGGGLVGFLWGMPETFGGSRNWSFTDVCQRRLNFGRRRQRGAPASGDRFAFEPGVAGGHLICPGRRPR